MKTRGELLPHKHEPIISYEFFQKVQEITQYIKNIYGSEGQFYQEQKNRQKALCNNT